MQFILDYIAKNSFLLFKHTTYNQCEVLFDPKGFWFTKSAQLAYNKLKSQPHLYVAYSIESQGYYYIGKSFQEGGRWKRSTAYHLGDLANTLLNKVKKGDHNHKHWVDNWMNVGSKKILKKNLYSIILKSPVYICFIPFEVYSNINYTTIEKKIVFQINTEKENLLIQSLLINGTNLLNVQNNENKSGLSKPTYQPKKLIIKERQRIVNVGEFTNSFSFEIHQNELLHNIANTKFNIPKGPCIVSIQDSLNTQQYLYKKKNGDSFRVIKTFGRTVSKYFSAPDTNYLDGKFSKSKVIQLEMKQKKIKTAKVNVYNLGNTYNSLEKEKNTLIPKSFLKNLNSYDVLLEKISKSFKLVFICANKKRANTDLVIGKEKISFRAASNVNKNQFHPDDIIPIRIKNQLKLKNIQFNLKNDSTWRDLLVMNDKYNNPLKIHKSYNLYERIYNNYDIYNDLNTKYGKNFYILSAGWGLINSLFHLPKYDITFSKAAKIENRRLQKQVYHDFNSLQFEESGDDIVFIGIADYVELFYKMTKNLKNKKFVIYNSKSIPKPPNNSFVLINYPSTNNRNWHYELVVRNFL